MTSDKKIVLRVLRVDRQILRVDRVSSRDEANRISLRSEV